MPLKLSPRFAKAQANIAFLMNACPVPQVRDVAFARRSHASEVDRLLSQAAEWINCLCAGRPGSNVSPPLPPPLMAIGNGSMIDVCHRYCSGRRAAEKHLAVYSVAANSSPLVQRDGRDYVGLLEVLEPLRHPSTPNPTDSAGDCVQQCRRRLSTRQDAGSPAGPRPTDLGGKFFFEDNRGLVPVVSLSSLLPHFSGGTVTLHEDAGRLFIGSVTIPFHRIACRRQPAPARLPIYSSPSTQPSPPNPARCA